MITVRSPYYRVITYKHIGEVYNKKGESCPNTNTNTNLVRLVLS